MGNQQWSGEVKYRALLEVSEAANLALDLSRVLDSVATALHGLVPIDAIGVITRDGEAFRSLAAYHGRLRRGQDESNVAYLQRQAQAKRGRAAILDRAAFGRREGEKGLEFDAVRSRGIRRRPRYVARQSSKSPLSEGGTIPGSCVKSVTS